MASLLIMRIQPDDTFVPIVQGSLVPWIGYSVSLFPCQRYMARPERIEGPTRDADATSQLAKLRAKSGLRWIISLGGYQSGHSCLSWMTAVPDQAKPSLPAPTP